MKEMNHYTLSERLLEVREKFSGGEYNEEATKKYFEGTIKHIHDYFTNTEWKSDYQFCSIGYFDNDKTTLIQYEYNSELLIEYHKALMDRLSQTWINKDRAISVTEMFLHPKTAGEHYKALLFNATEKKHHLKEFIYLDLKKIKWKYAGSLEKFNQKPFGSYNFQKLFFKKKGKVKNNPFLKITNNNPSELDHQQFDKLISVFAEISEGSDGDSFFYFLKPVTFQNIYNVVLLLGLKRELDPNEIELWLDKTRTIMSIIAEKKNAQVELLRGVSATTHALKTTINTLLSAPLNSLKSENKDFRIRLLSEAKETLLLNAELVNLLSKLSTTRFNYEVKEKALLDSKLFTSADNQVNLKQLIASRIDIFNLDKTGSQKEIKLSYSGNEKINKLFLCFQNLHPSNRFFEMIVLTVIENCNKHAKSKNYVVELNVENSESIITFSNEIESGNENDNQNYLTGNFLIIDIILKKLHLGKVELSSANDIFFAKIYTNQK